MMNFFISTETVCGLNSLRMISAMSAASFSINCPHFVSRPPSPVSSPQGEDKPQEVFCLADGRRTNPDAGISKNAGNVSPSPGGEGRGEDGRKSISKVGYYSEHTLRLMIFFTKQQHVRVLC